MAGWVFAIGVVSMARQSFAEPPYVVATTPGMADEMVDPATSEIRVEFSQVMSMRGHSICGGGPGFPELTGKPRWESARVLIVPVRLVPNHVYSMSFNCPAAMNFRSATGEALRITPLAFKTGEPGAKDVALAEAQVKRVLDTIERAIATRYSHREVHGADAAAIRQAVADRLGKGATRSQLAREIARALEPLNDAHIWLTCGEFALGTATGPSHVNFVPDRLQSALGVEVTRASGAVWTATLGDGVRYVMIANWNSGDAALLEPAREFIAKTPAECPGLVIDVRPNGGGDELAARSVAALLVDQPTVYARNDRVDPESPAGFTEVFDRVIEPAAARPPKPAKIAVLIGPACMSSNESFIQMMRHGARARLFGERTRGSSGNPQPHELCEGLTLMLPSWRDMEPDGQLIEGRGIEPDVTVQWNDAGKGDPVVEAAIEWIRGG